MTKITFKGKLWSPQPDMGSWTFLSLPKDASQKLGTKGMVRIKGTINGFPFATSAQPDGKGAHTFAVNKTMRDGAKADMGDLVTVVLETESGPRKEAKVPGDLQAALKKSAKAGAQWKSITPRAREEWIDWILSAKQDATKSRRVETTVKRLAAGDRRVYD